MLALNAHQLFNFLMDPEKVFPAFFGNFFTRCYRRCENSQASSHE
jgi:hypothetical protein